MKCKKVHTRLQSYFDGELAPAEHDRIEKHLKDCPVCSEELERLRTLSIMVKNLKAPEVDSSIWEGYSAAVLEKARSTPAKKIPLPDEAKPFRLLHPGLVYAAASIALVLVAAMIYHFTVLQRQPVEIVVSSSALQRPVIEGFGAGDPSYSVISFSPERSPVAVVWVFGCKIESGTEEEKGIYL